jgi:FkbM family methyltransferase
MEFTKHDQKFLVSDKHHNNHWFKQCFNNWENDTFHILDYYKNHKKSVYLDIGAWIGPTVLYAANIYNKVIAIEPDTVAINVLKDNISLNNYNNITLIEKGLCDFDGKANFGGNGELGNSMSSLIIANTNYDLRQGFQSSLNHNTIVEINTITIDSLIKEQSIDPDDISLIKMDIEGGEFIVVPHLKNFLKTYKPVFYISLHYVFLKETDIEMIVNILFEIYDNCFVFDDKGNKMLVDKTSVLQNKNTTLVFE